jgi:hypothetical protein
MFDQKMRRYKKPVFRGTGQKSNVVAKIVGAPHLSTEKWWSE